MSEQTKSLWAGMAIPIIGVTGGRGSGKSTWVSTIDPEGTCMIDLEKSTQTMATMFQPEGSTVTYGVPYKRRVDLYDEVLKMTNGRPPTSLDCFLWFKKFMEEVSPGEFSVIAVDPISDIEVGLQQWVYENAELFGKTKQQYDKFGGLIHGDIASTWKLMLGVQSAKCQTFAFTTHEGLVWKDGKPVPGQVKAKGKPILYELASLYLKLERKPNQKGFIPDVPTAYSTPVNGGKERLSLKMMVKGRLMTIPTIPPTIVECDPEKIREFIRNPVGLRELREDEKPAPADQRTDDERRDQKSTDLENAVRLEELRLSRLQLAEKAAKLVNEKAASVAASAPVDSARLAAAKAAAAGVAKPKKTKETPAATTAVTATSAAETTPVVTEVIEKKPDEVATSTEATIAAVTQPIEVSESKPVEATVEAEKPASTVQTESTEVAETTTTAAVDSTPGVTSPVWGIIRKQFAAFNKANPKFTEAAFSATLMDRYKVAVVDGLTQTQAEELRAALGTKLSNLGLDSDGEPTPAKK